MLEAKIAASADQMQAKLREIRSTFEHSGDKGSAVETAFRAFLEVYLPRRLAVGHGEVLDTFGNRSPQTDVVIVTEDHPFTFTSSEPGLFFIEGVAAAGEVKSVLNRTSLQEAIQNSIAFKRLTVNRSTRVIWNIGVAQSLERRPYFLIAMESKLRLSTIEKKLVERAAQGGIHPDGLLDFVLIVESGKILVNLGNGTGPYKANTSTGDVARGWTTFDDTSGLFHFLGWLSTVIPREVHNPSILTLYLLKPPP
jgi:hypothetical protein